MVDVILGLQWGDEGKGKIVDYFAPHYDIIARFQGGANAGHTLYVNNKKVVLHQIPSGIFHKGKINFIGNGVVLDIVALQKECEMLTGFGIDIQQQLYLSDRAHLILPTHIALDRANEISKGDGKIGSTLKGISPAYMDKTGRNGIRIGDLFHKDFESQYNSLRTKHLMLLKTLSFQEEIDFLEDSFFKAVAFVKKLSVVNGVYFINDHINKGAKILAEGAQGAMLDIDFGTFPFVTSSNTITAGVCTGLGVSPHKIKDVIGITKAYCTRVGNGPFPTELNDTIGEKLRKIGKEYGATTNRPRRCGWIDLVALKYACMLNGTTKIVMTKLDVLDSFEELKVCTAYNIDNVITDQMPYELVDKSIKPVLSTIKSWKFNISTCTKAENLPINTRKYVQFIEEYVQIPITHLSNGPLNEQVIPL